LIAGSRAAIEKLVEGGSGYAGWPAKRAIVLPRSKTALASACGFRDYTNFARKFRQRFGHSPSSHKGDLA
jgi:AraC-like DNA-binding protein